MRLPTFAAFCLILLSYASAKDDPAPRDPFAEHIAATAPRSPEDEGKQFKLPPGFVAELVAAEPDIHKPLNMNFDDKGRLWVTDTIEYPFPAAPGTKTRDTVKILEDLDEHGHARKITTYADNLNIPIGVLPLAKSAFVYTIPNIFRMSGEPKAEKREIVYQEFGHRDTHGMTSSFTLAFDGWVYACHGYANTSKVEGADKKPIVMQSGNTYRMKPDGSHAEYFTHGQVNPFGIAFTQLGDVFTCDCHTKPIMMLLRGGFYDSFGKPHDGLGYAPEMTGEYPDSTAIAGIAYYDANQFPAQYRNNAFIGDVVTCCVNEFVLDWHGSSPWATKREFLRSKDPWFRPVDVKLGPDGALYIADFYNRIIGHYEVPLDHPGRDRERGRIWRIVYRGEDGKGKLSPLPDFTKKSVVDLVRDLKSPNLTVRLKATNMLVDRPNEEVVPAVRALMKPETTGIERLHAAWVLERKGRLAPDLLAQAAKDPERSVRVHVQRILADRKELTDADREVVRAGLQDNDPFVQRCAADALGRHPKPENINWLMYVRAKASKEDTHLLHTVRMAMRDTLLLPATWDYLTKQWSMQDPKQVKLEKLGLVDVVLGAPTPEAASFLLNMLPDLDYDQGKQLNAAHHVARFAPVEDVNKLLVFAMNSHPDDLGHQYALFHALEQGSQERGAGLTEAARKWAGDMTAKLLVSAKPNEVESGITLAGTLKLESTQDKLAVIAGKGAFPEGQRIAAFNSLANIDGKKHCPLLGKVLADAEESLSLREQAANKLTQLNNTESQKELLAALPSAPARLQSIIALGLATSDTGGEKLLEAVKAGKASARLLQERPVQLRLSERKIAKVKERVAELTQGLKPADVRLQELYAQRREGFKKANPDLQVGATVYEKNCAICHQLAGKGAKIGPQLDGIGIRGIDRLLEDILDPNRNVDQAFRLTTLTLKNGTTVSGLLLRTEGEILVLADAQGKEVRVEKAKVDEQTTSQLSPMPGNFVDQVSEADFYNLLVFLLKQQQEKK
jgi:putative heme-binding domain-containing protein